MLAQYQRAHSFWANFSSAKKSIISVKYKINSIVGKRTKEERNNPMETAQVYYISLSCNYYLESILFLFCQLFILMKGEKLYLL